jgi:RNA-dependent RNA polymerase
MFIHLLLGDYDGDTALCIWDPLIVKPFKNANPKYLDEPTDLASHFESEVEKVHHFIARRSLMPTLEDRIRATQEILLGGIYDPNLVGIYSKMHMIAVFMLGYGTDVAWRLAYM